MYGEKPDFRTQLMRVWRTLGLILMGAVLLSPAIAKEAPVVACTYDLILDGEDAGDLFLERQAAPDGSLGMGTAMEIKVSGWWGSWHLRSSGRTAWDGDKLRRFDRRITEDNKSWRISGEYSDGALWCSAREAKQAKDEDPLTGLALSVAAATIPYAGLVMGLLKEGDGLKGDLRIPGEDFDTTDSGLALYLIKHQAGLGGKNTKALKVLDTGALEIKSWEFSLAGKESITLAGREFPCEKFLGRSDGQQATYWVARDHLGPFIAKETGKDKDGPYQVLLKTYKTVE